MGVPLYLSSYYCSKKVQPSGQVLTYLGMGDAHAPWRYSDAAGGLQTTSFTIPYPYILVE